MIGIKSIVATTPNEVLLGAGVYVKNLSYTDDNGWTGAILGVTSGGGKINVDGELVELDVDGAWVKFKGQTVKLGGTGSMYVTYTEVSNDLLATTQFHNGEDKTMITEGDYLVNFGFIGRNAEDTQSIVVVFECAICTSGIEFESDNKQQTVMGISLDAVTDGVHSIDKYPIKIYHIGLPQWEIDRLSALIGGIDDNTVGNVTVDELNVLVGGE